MLRDARALEDGAQIECDLGIVGGGAAGITLARALAGGKLKLCLLESGGLEFEEQVQDLDQGANVGLPYFDLDVCRLRFFGGSTNHWAGRCRPLDELDFEARPWVPHSGWPLTRAELEPYYREAQKICQLGAFDYRPGPWLDPGQPALPFDPAKVLSRVWQYSPPTRFGEVYRPELEAAANVDVLLHATVVDIEANEAGSEVLGLAVRTLEGKRATVRARAYVLACGGLENPRLLLAANKQVKVGLGNQQDLVGRYFMEHPHCNAARALVADPALLSFYTFGQGGGHAQGLEVVGCLNQSPERQRALQLLNFDSLFTVDDVGDSGFAALRRIWSAAGQGQWPDHLAADLWQALIDIDDTASGLMGRLGLHEYHPGDRELPDVVQRRGGAQSGQPGAPRRPARCAGHAPDRARLAAHRAGQALAARRLPGGRRGARPDRARPPADRRLADRGRRQLVADRGGRPPPPGHHPDERRPEQGVVDPSSKVHGIANLYIAGSSVFPTSGSANPTLTIVALALRLAAHLKERLTG